MAEMSKPPLLRIPSDDCEVVLPGGDQVFTPHVGEWIEVVSGTRVGDYRMFDRISTMYGEMQAVLDDPNGKEKVTAILDAAYDEVIPFMLQRVRRWNWTDDNGEPLPQPSFEVLMHRLRPTEFSYVMNLLRSGEAPAAAKKDGSDTPTTSSGIE